MRDIASGKSCQVIGVQALALKLNELQSVVASAEAYDVVGRAANIGRFEVEREMHEQNWPHETLECVFTYDKAGKSSTVSALLGIRKRGRSRPYAPAYVEWGLGMAGRKRVRKDTPSHLVGESLATMYEMGTSRQSAKPAFRPAVTATKAVMLAEIATGFQQIIESHAKP